MCSHTFIKQWMVCDEVQWLCGFTYITNLALFCLHEAGWIHGDFTPGNVIVVGETTKLSDLGLAKRWAVDQLKESTKQGDTPSHVGGDLPMVGSLLCFVGYTDPSQGTLRFMVIEVEAVQYMFLPKLDEDFGYLDIGDRSIQDDWMIEADGEERAKSPNGEDRAIGSTQNPTKRTFLHNPLHDYESVWWVAVWFVVYCELDGVADEVMERVRYETYKSRFLTFGMGRIIQICALLPPALRPLGEVLVKMRDILVCAYRSFEETFDTSKTLLVVHELKKCLEVLKQRSHGLDIKPPAVPRTLKEVGWLDAPGPEEGQSKRGQDVDSVLGKRARDDSSQTIDRVLKPRVGRV